MELGYIIKPENEPEWSNRGSKQCPPSLPTYLQFLPWLMPIVNSILEVLIEIIISLLQVAMIQGYLSMAKERKCASNSKNANWGWRDILVTGVSKNFWSNSVQFPAPMLYGSQLPLTPDDSGKLLTYMSTSSPNTHSTHIYTHTK